MDKYISAAKFALSAAVGYLLGGWDNMLQLLVAVMIVDFVTGLIVAGVFQKSSKTENGGLETRISFKGLIRKVCILMLVMIVTLLGRALGSSVFCRNTVVIFFTANEALSVLENIGLMGVKYPQWLKTALEVLNKNADNANSQTIGDLAVGGAVVQVSETTIKNEDGE